MSGAPAILNDDVDTIIHTDHLEDTPEACHHGAVCALAKRRHDGGCDEPVVWDALASCGCSYGWCDEHGANAQRSLNHPDLHCCKCGGLRVFLVYLERRQ